MSKKKIIIISVIISLLFLAILSYFLIVVPIKKEKEKQEKIEQLLQEHYDKKISQFLTENENTINVDVAFVGDSLTEGYDLFKHYPQYSVANRGISGDTTFGVEKRLYVSLYAIKPKVVVMLIGANNLDTMLENYEDILIDFEENLPDSKIILLSLTSMSKEWGKNNDKAIENNKIIKALAEKYNYTYVDLFNILLDSTTNELKEEYTTDGGHLTDLGYQEITKILTPILEEFLK